LEDEMNRILVVDDDTAIQLLYTDEFTEEGYEVITTGDGSGLVELIEEKRPDLVVLDTNSGGNEGLNRLQDIRSVYDDLPVVMSTAYTDFRVYGKSIAGEETVTRSADLKELKRKIKKVVESCRQFPQNTLFSDLKREAASM